MFTLYILYFVYLQISFVIENYTSFLGIGSFGISSVISQYTVVRRCVPNNLCSYCDTHGWGRI
jgi:hypothetical protein